MSNVLFDIESLKVVGTNREPLSFEVEIQNVDPSSLTKTIQVPTVFDKVDSNGNPLFLLPQDATETDAGITNTVETIENTGNPVMVTQIEKIPLLDENNDVVRYEVMTTDPDTGEQVGTGQWIDCYTTQEVTVQKLDSVSGLPLFYKDEVTVEKQYTPNPPLEITADDERYTAGLEKATETKDVPTVISFNDRQSEFTYSDVISLKESQIIEGTFFSQAVLIEQMDPALFSTDLSTFNSDFGFDLVSIPAGGTLRTQKVSLPKTASITRIITEASMDGLDVSVGALATDLQPIDDGGKRTFDSEVSSVYVQFKNSSNQRIDLKSIAILV